MIDLAPVLGLLTPSTIGAAILLGIALGYFFVPVYGRAIGAAPERLRWAVVVGLEVPALAFFAGTMAGRYLDGLSSWLLPLANILLWSTMVACAAVVGGWRRG